MESGFKSESRYSSGPDWQPITHHGSGHYEFFKVRYFGALHFVKRPTAEFRHDLMTIESLKKEFLIGYNLNHPNIARYMKLEDGAVYEEFIDGYSLREMIERDDKRLKSPEFLRRICRQLLEATSYLHSRGVIHNDIKPENVIVARIADQLKLVDLGAATSDMWDATEGFTLEYKAPEQGSDATNVQTDIYLIGKLMQELSPKAGAERQWKNFIKKATAENATDRFSSDFEALESITEAKDKNMIVFVVAALLLIGAFGWYALFYQPGYRDEVDSTAQSASPPPQIIKDTVILYVPQNKDIEREVPDKQPTTKEIIDAKLKKYVIERYNIDVLPESKKYSSVPDEERMEFEKHIISLSESVIADIMAYAEDLAVKYPQEADYARLQASVLINAQQSIVSMTMFPISGSN